jgi:hypothetical protein
MRALILKILFAEHSGASKDRAGGFHVPENPSCVNRTLLFLRTFILKDQQGWPNVC